MVLGGREKHRVQETTVSSLVTSESVQGWPGDKPHLHQQDGQSEWDPQRGAGLQGPRHSQPRARGHQQRNHPLAGLLIHALPVLHQPDRHPGEQEQPGLPHRPAVFPQSLLPDWLRRGSAEVHHYAAQDKVETAEPISGFIFYLYSEDKIIFCPRIKEFSENIMYLLVCLRTSERKISVGGLKIFI